MKEFQETLKRFTEILQKRKVFSKLGIPSRDPRTFDLGYVLAIATRISEWRDADEDTRICKRFIRKFCQKATKHKNVLSGLISLAPSDTYGSVISGGFTLILAAIEGHEKLRVEMQGSLAEIPRKLGKITKLTNIQIKRDELHQQSITSKFKDAGAGGHIKDALHALEESINDFNEEAVVCAQLRLGRIEENGLAVKLDSENILAVVERNGHKSDDIMRFLKDFANGLNKVYSFAASNSAFDAIDGTLRKDHLLSEEKQSGNLSLKEKSQLVNDWLQSLHGFDPSSEDHVKKCVSHTGNLDMSQQDKILYILESKVFQEWLNEPGSLLLHIRAETKPADIINFISVSTASLASTLESSTNFAVLSFFCGIRKSSSLSEGDSGMLGMLKSLNGQMLQFILDKQPGVDNSVPEGRKVWKKSATSIQYAWKLFRSLILGLPNNTVVFILLDSVSSISGDKTQVDDLVQKIMKMAANREEGSIVVIKVLVTDSLPSSRIREMAKQWHTLYVPDEVDGWNCGINHRAVKEKNILALQNLHIGNDSSESSDSPWDLSSDDGRW
ncbi:hypothetical protein N0V82_004941 [Gnomoniopsis sp. IMI 355080]|nr:hypothetical protein N0V82_004941 [Gnomoniopsis sp. IMI 355080]